MPLFVADDKIDERLNNPANVLFKLIGSGRPAGKANGPNRKLDTDTKAFIGKLAILDSTNGAAQFSGLSPTAVSDIKNGTMRNHQNPEVQEKIGKSLKDTRNLAIDKLVGMMESMTPEKLKDLSPIQAAIAAEKMAGVHEKLSNKGQVQIGPGAQIIYMAPRQKTESDYPAIEAEVVSR